MARLIRIGQGQPGTAVYREGIDCAAELVRQGGLVAFPTETVYGLAADALNPTAVARVYEVKERPLDSALILHLADVAEAPAYARDWPPEAATLAEAFWPGPLTLVLPKASIVPDITTGGRDNVGLRVPDHAVARDLIRTAGRPVVGPSANLSGRPSPMTPLDVLDELGDRIDAVLDAGSTHLGIESTVLDIAGRVPTVVRLGSISPAEISARLGRQVVVGAKPEVPVGGPVPGPRHGLRFRLLLVDQAPSEAALQTAVRLATQAAAAGLRAAVLAQGGPCDVPPAVHFVSLGGRGDLRVAAARLYPALRECEAAGHTVVIAAGLERVGLGLAIMQRLEKMAAEVVRT